MNRSKLIAALVLMTTATLQPARAASPAPEEEAAFHATEALGKQIAETDLAGSRATDLLLASEHDDSRAGLYFALLDHDTFYVYFGRLSRDGETFTPGYVATCPRGHLDSMHLIDPDKAPAGAVVAPYARGVRASTLYAAKEGGTRQANPVLVPGANGFDVYVLAGTEAPDLVPFGSDWHDQWDATGKKLIAREQLHATPMMSPRIAPPLKDGAAPPLHVHTLIEGPSATDVALTLEYPKSAPLYIKGKSGAGYRVDADGTIHRVELAAAPALAPASK